MPKLYVVRHADAGSRGSGPDEERALTDRGERQADGLCGQLGEAGITRLLASPYLRCMQTLVPLGRRLGVEVEADERLAEGQGPDGALALVAEVAGTDAALCSHGDVIPDLLEALLARGTRFKDELRWQKASTWVFTWDGDELGKGSYLPPPA